MNRIITVPRDSIANRKCRAMTALGFTEVAAFCLCRGGTPTVRNKDCIKLVISIKSPGQHGDRKAQALVQDLH